MRRGRLNKPPPCNHNADVYGLNQADRQLVRLIRTGQADPPMLPPTGLVIRRSCGCP